MTDITKPWVATEGLKRAEYIVQQLAEDGAANNNIIGPMLQHRMRETIGRALDIALQQVPAAVEIKVQEPRHANGDDGWTGPRTVTITRGSPITEGKLSTGYIAEPKLEQPPPAPKRARRKGGRRKKPVAGAEA